jgi:hypothetical protein
MSNLIDVERVRDGWLREQRERAADPKSADRNWISSAGDVCDRRLVLQRIKGEEAAPPNEYLQFLFKRGNQAERFIARQQMIDAGYEFYEPQSFRIVENDEVLWSGRTDGSVRDPGMGPDAPVIPWECKMLNTFTWKSIHSLDDILHHKSAYIRGLPAQLMLYIYSKGTNEKGVFHLIDSESWAPKFIDLEIDYEYTQALLDRGRMVNRMAVSGNLPPPIEWADDVCGRCRFLNVCMPDQIRTMGGLQMWQLPGMEEKLLERERLKDEMRPLSDQFDELDKYVKHVFKAAEGNQFAVGDFLVVKSDRNVKGYEVKPRVDTIVQVKRVGLEAQRESA